MYANPARLSSCLVISTLALCLFAGCGAPGPTHLRASIEAEPGANGDAPVAIAVLVLYEDAVFREFMRLKASDWFEQSEQRQRDNPDRKDFDLVEWEVMPNQVIPETPIELQGRPAEGIVFADYLSEGDHRIRFNPENRIVIVLGSNDFNVVKKTDD